MLSVLKEIEQRLVSAFLNILAILTWLVDQSAQQILNALQTRLAEIRSV
jgi:hypothetical protein